MTTSTHYRPPTPAQQRFNALIRWLADHGIRVAGAQTLTVTGRRSGSPQRIPVNPHRSGGREYLVSPRGTTQWVRNVRVTPAARLGTARRGRDVVLREVTDAAEQATVISGYLARWGWEVGQYLPEGLAADRSDASIREHAGELPVFEIVTPGE